MKPFTFACPQCAKKFAIRRPESQIGRRMRCTGCGGVSVIRVPTKAEDADASALIGDEPPSASSTGLRRLSGPVGSLTDPARRITELGRLIEAGSRPAVRMDTVALSDTPATPAPAASAAPTAPATPDAGPVPYARLADDPPAAKPAPMPAAAAVPTAPAPAAVKTAGNPGRFGMTADEVAEYLRALDEIDPLGGGEAAPSADAGGGEASDSGEIITAALAEPAARAGHSPSARAAGTGTGTGTGATGVDSAGTGTGNAALDDLLAAMSSAERERGRTSPSGVFVSRPVAGRASGSGSGSSDAADADEFGRPYYCGDTLTMEAYEAMQAARTPTPPPVAASPARPPAARVAPRAGLPAPKPPAAPAAARR